MQQLFLLLLLSSLIASSIINTNVFIPRTYFSGTFVHGIGGFMIGGGLDISGNCLNTIELCIHQCQIYPVNLSQPRGNMQITYLEKYNLVFFAGGYCNGNYYNIIDILNVTSNNITQKYLPFTQNGLLSANIAEQSLIFYSDSVNPINYIYNYTNDSWTLIFDNLSAIIIATLPQQNLLLISGMRTDGYNYILLLYDIVTKVNKTLILNFYANAVTAFQEEGLVAFTDGTTIAIYNYSSNNIYIVQKPFPIVLTGGYGTVPTSKNGLIFIAGGDQRYLRGLTNKIIIYNIYTDVWSINYLPNAVNSPVGISTKSAIAFIGGISKTQISTDFSLLSYAPEGYYQHIGNLLTQCPAGYVCPAGSMGPNYCESGTYCPEKSYQQIPCPAGTYGPFLSGRSILDCVQCPAGTFNIFLKQNSPDSCATCSPGFYCPIASPLTIPCPSNYYCPDTTRKIPCPEGTHFDGNYATDISFCQTCSPGFFCPGNGLPSQQCQAGTYTEKGGVKQCSSCPKGNFCPFGTLVPTICPTNSFSLGGAVTCTSCEEGQFTVGPGASECISCPSSRFSLDGWWCMNTFEKIIFLGVWVGSIASGTLSLYKAYSFYKERLSIIKNAGYKPSLKTFLFLERMSKRNINLTELVEEREVLKDEQFRKINEIVLGLQERISLLESR